MNRIRWMACLAPVMGIAMALTYSAQDFDWRGRLAPGRTIEIKGVNGPVEAVLASGPDVRVTAVRRAGSRGRPEDVTIEVVEHAGGVTICAVYPSERADQPNECQPGSGGRMSVRENDTKVDFRVEVPRGVAFSGRTINGDVLATSLEGEVSAHTVNGDVVLSSTGVARASSVNGSLDVAMGSATWTGDLALATVNGSITVAFGGDVNAEVAAETVNGSISTDFPLTVRGRFGPKRLRGTLGQGGRTLSLSTVNGSIELRRR